MTDLTGKTALVTGSLQGIGLAVAKALAGAGARIAVHGLGGDGQIREVCDTLKAAGAPQAEFFHGDLREPDRIVDLMQAVADWGGADIVVNNAGVQHTAPLALMPRDKWNDILAINLSSAFHAIRASLPGMKERGWGRIVNIASAHGLVASPFKSAYVAAKHGIVGLTKVVALESAQAGITCNAICPGYVWTPLVEKQIGDQAAAHNLPREKIISDVLLKSQPNKRFAEVVEIGALTAFLCSQSAASITGTALPVDGGWTAQ